MVKGIEVSHHYYHGNHQGSIVALSIGNELTPEVKYSYDAFGIPSGNDDLGGQPFRYTGRRWDEETGLYYYRARYYRAELGRFLQTDPIGYEDNMNLYAYTNNDPVNNTDPTGLRCPECGNGSLAKKLRDRNEKMMAPRPTMVVIKSVKFVNPFSSSTPDATATGIATDVVETQSQAFHVAAMGEEHVLPKVLGKGLGTAAEGYEAYNDYSNGLPADQATMEFAAETAISGASGSAGYIGTMGVCALATGGGCAVAATVVGGTTAIVGSFVEVETARVPNPNYVSPEDKEKK